MSNQTPITLFTSLPPVLKRPIRGVDVGPLYQRACIDSWISAGFRVVSLNSHAEIKNLKKLAFPVDYIPSAYARPRIAEFISAAKDTGSAWSGIINADCFLIDHGNVVSRLGSSAMNGILILERANIEPTVFRPSGRSCLGFDGFLFSKQSIDGLDLDEELAIGQPWWDYSFPISVLQSGVSAFKLDAPMLFHIDHEQRWDDEGWKAFGRRLFARMEQRQTEVLPQGLAEKVLSGLSKENELSDLFEFSIDCFNYIRDSGPTIGIASDDSASRLAALICQIFEFNIAHMRTIEAVRPARLPSYVSMPPPQRHAAKIAPKRLLKKLMVAAGMRRS